MEVKSKGNRGMWTVFGRGEEDGPEMTFSLFCIGAGGPVRNDARMSSAFELPASSLKYALANS